MTVAFQRMFGILEQWNNNQVLYTKFLYSSYFCKFSLDQFYSFTCTIHLYSFYHNVHLDITTPIYTYTFLGLLNLI